MAGFKKVFKILLLLLFLGKQSKFSDALRPATKEKGNIKMWTFGFGILQQFGTSLKV